MKIQKLDLDENWSSLDKNQFSKTTPKKTSFDKMRNPKITIFITSLETQDKPRPPQTEEKERVCDLWPWAYHLVSRGIIWYFGPLSFCYLFLSFLSSGHGPTLRVDERKERKEKITEKWSTK